MFVVNRYILRFLKVGLILDSLNNKMNSKSIWNDQIPEKDGVKTPVNDIAISPDGSRVIAAVGNRVLLYKAENGDLIESLRGHKDTVYSVSFSCDGTRFSSGK